MGNWYVEIGNLYKKIESEWDKCIENWIIGADM